MRKRPRTRIVNSSKLLNEVRSVFMTDGRTFSDDLVTGLPKIIVPINRDHTDLYLYRIDGNKMIELSYGIPSNNGFPEDADWTVSRIDIINNKFYITINPNSDRARVNGVIDGSYRVGSGFEHDGRYIDFVFNSNEILKTLTDSQFVDGRISVGPIGTTTYSLDGSTGISQESDDLNLDLPPQEDDKNKTKKDKNKSKKDTVNEWLPPPEDVDSKKSANTEKDKKVEEEVQDYVEKSGETNNRKGTLIFKNFPPCGELTINGEKYESEIWYRYSVCYGVVKDVPRGNCDIEIKFGDITFADSVELRGRSARVFVDVFPIVYLVGLRRNWGVNIDGTSVPCIHDIVTNLSIITSPTEGSHEFTIKLPEGKTKEFEMDTPVGYTAIMLDRYPVKGEEPVESTEFWSKRRRKPRRMPQIEQPVFIVEPDYEERFYRRRQRDIDYGYGGFIDPYGEYTMGAGRMDKNKMNLAYVAAAAVAGFLIWKTVKK